MECLGEDGGFCFKMEAHGDPVPLEGVARSESSGDACEDRHVVARPSNLDVAAGCEFWVLDLAQ